MSSHIKTLITKKFYCIFKANILYSNLSPDSSVGRAVD